MGELKNCRTCGHGSAYWWRNGTFCPCCESNPHIAGAGRPDWEDFNRAKFINRFGPRMVGDEELLAKYHEEIK